MLAFSHQFVDPLLSATLLSSASGGARGGVEVERLFRVGWMAAVGSTVAVGFVGFRQSLGGGEVGVAGMAWMGELLHPSWKRQALT